MTVVVATIGGGAGAAVGLIASIAAFAAWASAAADGPEFPITVLMGFALFIVPVATVSGVALAVKVRRRWLS